MAPLLSSRVVPSSPFSMSGVDFVGPFLVLQRGRGNRLFKSYLAVFVCFSTKAVHLEAVEDLSTDAFMKCLSRFISRRSKPKQLFSNNGKKNVGAKDELKRV